MIAQRIFPRCNVVAAILHEVGRLDPDDLPDVDSLAAILVRAAEIARSPFAEPPMGRVQAEAIGAESEWFDSAVRTWMSDTGLMMRAFSGKALTMILERALAEMPSSSSRAAAAGIGAPAPWTGGCRGPRRAG